MMTYDMLGPGALDYAPCRYGTSKLTFRGPARDLRWPFVAFLGGAETYGRFMAQPFPALVEREVGRICVNFGQPNAGIDVFALDPEILTAASRAEATVIEVPGACNLTNRFYAVHPRRNDRFVSASPLLARIYPEVDFAEFHFINHMLTRLQDVSAERFEVVREEVQKAWVARMKLLLRQIGGIRLLLWLGDGPAPNHGAGAVARIGSGAAPAMVTRDMMAEVAPAASEVLTVVVPPAAIAAGRGALRYTEMEQAAAARMLGAEAHALCAETVSAALVHHLGPVL